jgi:ubiquinone/menaquinone biosynthesis C-methylase UbiE
MPFKDASLSAVLSLFFTDVIPIHQWINEIYRSLSKNGVFIHIGPLDYHFEDLEYQYSVEEMKEIFKQHQFEIIYEDFKKMPHLNHGERHMSMKLYNTWVFVARKI